MTIALASALAIHEYFTRRTVARLGSGLAALIALALTLYDPEHFGRTALASLNAGDTNGGFFQRWRRRLKLLLRGLQ
jgi:hypothetical protein